MICKVLQDTGDAVQEKIRNEVRNYKEEVEERKLELINIAIAKVKCIESQGSISLTQLNEALKSSIDVLDSKLQEKVEQGKQNIEDAGTEAVQRVTEEKKKTLREIHNAKEGKKCLKSFYINIISLKCYMWLLTFIKNTF